MALESLLWSLTITALQTPYALRFQQIFLLLYSRDIGHLQFFISCLSWFKLTPATCNVTYFASYIVASLNGLYDCYMFYQNAPRPNQ